RRDALKVLATAGLTAPALGCIRRPAIPEPKKELFMSTAPASTSSPAASKARRTPSIFLAHGSPLLLTDHGWMDELAAWARALSRPKAVLMLSAHWLDKPVTIGATTPVPLVYDFSGFPAEFFRTKYPAPGAPALPARVREPLGPDQTTDQPDRALDHGAHVPPA